MYVRAYVMEVCGRSGRYGGDYDKGIVQQSYCPLPRRASVRYKCAEIARNAGAWYCCVPCSHGQQPQLHAVIAHVCAFPSQLSSVSRNKSSGSRWGR